ncbi:MAG: gliding motility-associated C-terminal domain-containing protein [Bacteroidota bacterium]
MTRLIKSIIAGLLWLVLLPYSYSQIGSPDADAEKEITYTLYPGSDKVFVYYSYPGENVTATLRADAPQAGNFNFEWSKYNPGDNNWDASFRLDTQVAFSNVSGLTEGGYRVHVTNEAGVDTFYYGWVFMNDFRVDLEETEDGRVKTGKYFCNYLILNGSVSVDSFFYYDPLSHDSIKLVNDYSFLWTSDDPDFVIPMPDRNVNTKSISNPPVVDTWFILTAVDSFGMEDVDSVFYETIEVKAEFNYEFFDKADTEAFVSPPAGNEDDAPLEVRFTNQSVNGYSFEWIFTDTIESDVYADTLTEDENYQPVYTYTIPDDYYPKLIATSEAGCVDSFQLEEPITVVPSELDAPNVFSPNGDTYNDVFKVSFKSLKAFTIRIYSRTGNLVYKADVKDMYDWEGWDGTILNSNRKATPGAYFYVIEATGYDEVFYDGKPYTGVVYLFRDK